MYGQVMAGYRCLCRGLASRRVLSQRLILPLLAYLAYILPLLIVIEVTVYTLTCLYNV